MRPLFARGFLLLAHQPCVSKAPCGPGASSGARVADGWVASPGSSSSRKTAEGPVASCASPGSWRVWEGWVAS